MVLFISEFGTIVEKSGERIVLLKDGKTLEEKPFMEVDHVLVTTSGASLSSDFIQECAQRGIPISFVSASGKPFAKLYPPNLNGAVKTRRDQMLAYNDERGVILSKAFLEGKIRNQINLVKYFAKYIKLQDSNLYIKIYQELEQLTQIKEELTKVSGPCIETVRDIFLSLEVKAADIYWNLVKKLIKADVKFEGREVLGAKDPVNSLLNYGYGVLYHQVWSAVVLAGLDELVGFLHVDRPGEQLLVLDFIEEFRQAVVDRVVVALINKGIKIEIEGEDLSEKTRRELAERVLARLENEENYEGKRCKIRIIIQLQARRIANFLRGETYYRPFVSSW